MRVVYSIDIYFAAKKRRKPKFAGWSLAPTGKFVDEEFFTFDRQPFMVKGYVGGGRAAIVAWNITAHEHRFAPKLHAQRRFIEGASVGGPFRPGDLLPAHSVGVLVYN